MVFPLRGYQNFYLLPLKLDFLPKNNQNWLFWPNIGIFGPFGPMADQKNKMISTDNKEDTLRLFVGDIVYEGLTWSLDDP